MKDRIISGVLAALLLSPIAACSLFTPHNVRGVLDAAHAACVLFHDDVDDVVVLGNVCGISEDYWPEVRKLVSARKQAAARKAAMAAPSSSASQTQTKEK